MEAYRINLDSENHFEVDSILLNEIRIVNIRSVRGKIGGENFDAKDDVFRRLLKEYLKSAENVELLNVLSRDYNGWNWFEAYDTSREIKHEITKEQLLENTSGEVGDHSPTSEVIDIERFRREVKDTNRHLKPSALYKYLHKGIPRNEKINLKTVDFIPVWYINGSINNGLCELFCCFEVLIHLLAKRFIDFKAKLLQLTSTNVQLTKARNQTLDRYLHFSQEQLIRELGRVEKERDDLRSKVDQLLEENRHQSEKIDELLSQSYQQIGMLEEAAEERQALLAHDEARAKDNRLIKTKLNLLCDKVANLNASNYDDEGSVIFIWTLFRSEEMRIGYAKPVQNNAIWIYSSIREDKNRVIPPDAEILFEANVVSRTIYEALTQELKPLIIDSFYRHILISYDNANVFIERLNELVLARGIHPETYNIEALNTEIETRKAEAELEQRRREKTAQQIAVRQEIIDKNERYIYYAGRWRLLYNKDKNGSLTTNLRAVKFLYVRTGNGGKNIERLQTRTLMNSRFRDYGDERIHYEP